MLQNSCHNLGFGLGLRAPHYEEILRDRPKNIDWFEIISENYLDAHEGYWDFLADIRRDYPIVMHGVSMSIGGTDPFDAAYVQKLKNLIDFLQPAWVSDHLCFTAVKSHNTHDLLPIPYTQESLRHVSARILEMQERLGRALVIENPSTYLEFEASEIPEAEFLSLMAEATGCGLLLDINNVYVSSFNHNFDARAYVDAIPARSIAQIHLAGHQNLDTHIIDTHDDHVIDPVWDLYAYALAQKGARSTMIEWDDKIPPLATLIAELDKARAIAAQQEMHVLQRRA
jgi:uncharacterized protein